MFWKFCKNCSAENYVANFNTQSPFSESFINSLPIDFILENDDFIVDDSGILNEYPYEYPNQTVLEEIVVPIVNEIITSTIDVVERRTRECFQIMLWNVVDSAIKISQDMVSRKKIKILDIKTIKIPENVWKKHLHWPSISVPATKRKTNPAPYAITSKKWKEYHEAKKQKTGNPKKQTTSSDVKIDNKTKRKTSSNQEDGISAKRIKSQKKSKTQKNVSQIPSSTPSVDTTLLEVGDYVMAIYDDTPYPGKIIEIDRDKYKIGVMYGLKKQNKWKWPTKPDECWYELKHIQSKISTPSLQDNGFYAIKDFSKFCNQTTN